MPSLENTRATVLLSGGSVSAGSTKCEFFVTSLLRVYWGVSATNCAEIEPVSPVRIHKVSQGVRKTLKLN